MSSDYQRGYLDGFRDGDTGQIGLAEAQRLTFVEAMGGNPDAEAEADYWIGYYHGQFHGKTHHASDGARGRAEIPEGF